MLFDLEVSEKKMSCVKFVTDDEGPERRGEGV